MMCADIDYGHGTAKMWGDFDDTTIERAFYKHANECFGIRKSISRFRLLAIVPCEHLPEPWNKLEGAKTMLSHSGGDKIVWDGEGNKIKSEFD